MKLKIFLIMACWLGVQIMADEPGIVRYTDTELVFFDQLTLENLVTHGKNEPFATMVGVRKEADGSLLIDYQLESGAAARKVKDISAVGRMTKNGMKIIYSVKGNPGNIMQQIVLGQGVRREAGKKLPFARLYSDYIPTRQDERDIAVRIFRRDGGREFAMIVNGTERWGTDSLEHLRFVRQPDGVYQAELEITALIPYENSREPLAYANHYSMELAGDLKQSDGFFPLGVLGEKFENGFTPFIGGNYEVKGGSPDFNMPLNRQGVYGISIWGAIRNQANKKVKHTMDDRGVEQRQVCLFDRESREIIFDYARKSVAKALEQDGDKIFKWEIDNEYIPPLDYSPDAVAAFHVWLEKSYKGDLAGMNKAWRTEYKAFNEAIPPKLDEVTQKPAAFMDWSRFQQETFAEFLGEYYSVIYHADPLRRGVNGKDTQSSLEMQRIARTRRSNHELIGQAVAPYTGGVRGMDHYGHGDRNAYELNYYYNTIVPIGNQPGKRRGMLYGENNNHNGPGWQFAQTVWRTIPNGFRGGHFFCNGWFGCWGDWSSFGFTYPDGTRRDKFYYLPRFYSMIHRAEKFFTQCAIPAETQKVAILLAQRDIPFGVDDNITPWGFPINSRLRVYSHLRNAGYWVQVITYDKLKPEYMKDIKGLFLVSAEHMNAEEIARIREYVKGGGRLFADTRAGFFDEHHREHEIGLSDVLGIRFKGLFESHDVVVDPGDVWFGSPYGNLVRADGRVKFALDGAKIVNDYHAFVTSNKAGILTRNKYGKGEAYWINTQMGTVRSESALGEAPASGWFRTLLENAGVEPSYSLIPESGERLRVEVPVYDEKGNCYLAVTGTTYQEIQPALLKLKLPRKCDFKYAFISTAEEYGIHELPFKRNEDGTVEFPLPALKSAASLYLFRDHAPLMGMRVTGSFDTVKVDPATPEFKSGDEFKVVVQIANPSDKALKPGQIVLRALTDWQVSAPCPTGEVKPGAIGEYQFTVKIPQESKALIPNFVYPLIAEYEVEGKRQALVHSVVSVKMDLAGKELLLSDNWSAENYPWAIWTGVDYRYLTVPPEGSEIKDNTGFSYGDATVIGALLSGDRSDRRRYATFVKLPEVDVLFDLKNEYAVTRLLVRRANAGETPVLFKISLSGDGKEFSEPLIVKPDWQGGYAQIPLPQTVNGRYVKIQFTFPSGGPGVVDEVWIFGKLIPGKPFGKPWLTIL